VGKASSSAASDGALLGMTAIAGLRCTAAWPCHQNTPAATSISAPNAPTKILFIDHPLSVT